jgi:hypothetical protein
VRRTATALSPDLPDPFVALATIKLTGAGVAVVRVMDNVKSAVVPARLFDPQTLGRPPQRSGAAVRLGAVLLALAVTGLGAGHLMARPSRAGVVVSGTTARTMGQ